jgi:hypothetical protein
MSANSEARKRAEDLARVADAERRREVMRDALAEVLSGADFTDADAVLDHMADRGLRVEVS